MAANTEVDDGKTGCDDLRSEMIAGTSTPPRIAFLFNAQRHHILHGGTSAAALARGWDADVRIMAPSRDHLAYARLLAERYAASPLAFEEAGWPLLNRLSARTGRAVPPKFATLLTAWPALAKCDAIILPERTTTILRRWGMRRPHLIHIDHGAGDRAAGFDPRIALFDFVLMAGEKHRRRLLAEKLVRPGHYAVAGYPKFEAADLMRVPGVRIFADDRPIILYNPHFSTDLGSWHRFGSDIVTAIAESGRYNLIVAPHVRLCDRADRRAAVLSRLAHLRNNPHVHIDLGSERCVDMSYIELADLYLGDVSSQVYEFLRKPRPCLFVNPSGHRWEGDPNYAHWAFGPVIDRPGAIVASLDEAFASHDRFLGAQLRGFAETFDLRPDQGSSQRVAAAIAAYLGLRPRDPVITP
ncbi:MAG: hypothetical protein JWR77_1528 [Rhizorhabdus sp.]|nr:hypothetical protein [Rhizorhabdus sp.]